MTPLESNSPPLPPSSTSPSPSHSAQLRERKLPREISSLRGHRFVLAPLLQDDDKELSVEELQALVNTRRDPDVVGHNLLSVITVEHQHGSGRSKSLSASSLPASSSPPAQSSSSSPSSSSISESASAAAGGAVAVVSDGVEYLYSWAAFLASLWRSDDPDATFEPSVCPVTTADFLPYMRRVNKDFNAYNHAIRRQSERHGKGIDAAAERAAFRAASILSPDAKASSGRMGLDMEELVLLTRPKAQDLLDAERHLEMTLATVPRMFFSSDFDFRNPETFLAVTEMPGVVQSVVRPELPLRLGEHLDMVELSLCKQVSVRAGAFYRAQASLRESHEKVRRLATKIADLRHYLKSLQDKNVNRPLGLIRLQRRLHNLRRVKKVVEDVKSVQSAHAVIRELLTQSDFHGALDLLDNTRLTVNTRLARIRGLTTYRRQLDQYEELIVRTMAQRLEVAAVRFHAEAPQAEKHLRAELEPLVSGLLRTGKLEYVMGQHRKRMEAEILTVGKTVVRAYLEAFDDGTGTVNMEDGSEGRGKRAEEGKNGVVDEEDHNWRLASDQLKKLKPVQFNSFLELLFERFLVVISQATAVHKLLISALDMSVVTSDENIVGKVINAKVADTDMSSSEQAEDAEGSASRKEEGIRKNQQLSSVSSSTTVVTRREQKALHNASLDVVVSTCVKAGRSVAGVLEKRKARHATLTVSQMKTLSDLCTRFAEKVERSSSNRMTCFLMRGKILDHAKAMLKALHDRHTQTMRRVLDREKWKQVEVPRRVQALLTHIQDVNSEESFERILFGAGAKVGNISSATELKGDNKDSDIRKSYTSQSVSKTMLFGNVKYRVAGSMQTLVTLICEYLNCAHQIRPLGRQVCLRLTELLRLYNKETKRLVLRAGALKSSARLPSISIKALAVSAQSIELTTALIPSLRISLASYLLPKFHMMLNDLDVIAKECRTHRDALFQKFVTMIEVEADRAFHSGEIQEAGPPIDTISWDDVPSEIASAGADVKTKDPKRASKAMTYFLQKVRLLHSGLQKYLPPDQLKEVFSMIFSKWSSIVPPFFRFI